MTSNEFSEGQGATATQRGTSPPPITDFDIGNSGTRSSANTPAETATTGDWLNQVEELEERLESHRTLIENTRKTRKRHQERLDNLRVSVNSIEEEIKTHRELIESNQQFEQEYKQRIEDVYDRMGELEERTENLESSITETWVRSLSTSEINKRVVAPAILWLTTALLMAAILGAYYNAIIISILLMPAIGAAFYYLWRSRDDR